MVIDGLEGEMYGNELKMYYMYKDNLPSIWKITLRLLQFGFSTISVRRTGFLLVYIIYILETWLSYFVKLTSLQDYKIAILQQRCQQFAHKRKLRWCSTVLRSEKHCSNVSQRFQGFFIDCNVVTFLKKEKEGLINTRLHQESLSQKSKRLRRENKYWRSQQMLTWINWGDAPKSQARLKTNNCTLVL